MLRYAVTEMDDGFLGMTPLPKVGPMRGRLKRVFNIDITTCEECGGTVKVVAN
jgi:hypothetical protein